MCLQNFDEATLEAKWVVDSESGEQYLLNLRTGAVLATKNKEGIWTNPEEKHENL